MLSTIKTIYSKCQTPTNVNRIPMRDDFLEPNTPKQHLHPHSRRANVRVFRCVYRCAERGVERRADTAAHANLPRPRKSVFLWSRHGRVSLDKRTECDGKPHQQEFYRWSDDGLFHSKCPVAARGSLDQKDKHAYGSRIYPLHLVLDLHQ